MKAVKEAKPKKKTTSDILIEVITKQELMNNNIRGNGLDINLLTSDIKRLTARIDMLEEQATRKGWLKKIFTK